MLAGIIAGTDVGTTGFRTVSPRDAIPVSKLVVNVVVAVKLIVPVPLLRAVMVTVAAGVAMSSRTDELLNATTPAGPLQNITMSMYCAPVKVEESTMSLPPI